MVASKTLAGHTVALKVWCKILLSISVHFVAYWEVLFREFLSLTQDFVQIVLPFLGWLLSHCRFLCRLGLFDSLLGFFRFDVVCWFLACCNKRLSDLAHFRPCHLCTSTGAGWRLCWPRAWVSFNKWATRTLKAWGCWLTWCVPRADVLLLVIWGHDNAALGTYGLYRQDIWIIVCLLTVLNFDRLPVFVVCYFALVFVKIIEMLLVGALGGCGLIRDQCTASRQLSNLLSFALHALLMFLKNWCLNRFLSHVEGFASAWASFTFFELQLRQVLLPARALIMWPRMRRLVWLSLPLDSIANYQLAVLMLVELFQVKFQCIHSTIARDERRVVLLSPRYFWHLRYVKSHFYFSCHWWRSSRFRFSHCYHIFGHELSLPRWSCWRLITGRRSCSLYYNRRHRWKSSCHLFLWCPEWLLIKRRLP